jgi:hypothetical protein
LQAYAETKAAEDAARLKAKEAYEATLHPWEAEMKMCDSILVFLKAQVPAEALGAAPAATSVAAAACAAPAAGGHGVALPSKYERDNESSGFFGGAKKAASAPGTKSLKVRW